MVEGFDWGGKEERGNEFFNGIAFGGFGEYKYTGGDGLLGFEGGREGIVNGIGCFGKGGGLSKIYVCIWILCDFLGSFGFTVSVLEDYSN